MMIMRKLRTEVSMTRRPRRPSDKPTKLAQRMEALQEAEDARQVFLQCSGMHTPYIQWIIHQICFRTRWVTTPGTCAEFVVPALTNGISQHWENVVAAQAEIAVYAALFMSIYANMFLGGFAPANSTVEDDRDFTNERYRAYFGSIVGTCLGIFNILCAVLYRLAGAFLPRESDKLAVLWTYRWLPPLNALLFCLGMIVGMKYAQGSGANLMSYGDFCMPDGSLGYLDWYVQWVRESYPTGKGVIHPLNETILNPWAVVANATGIKRPNNTKYLPVVETFRWRSPEPHHASFDAYEEFMAHHLDLKGGGCFGGMDITPILLFGFNALLLAMVTSRSPLFHWFRSRAFKNLFRRTKWKAGTSADEDNAGDPYDLSAIYEEYKVRAAIGQQMANKDANRDGIVKPVAEGAYVLSESSNILGDASTPTPIALDAPVLAALQQAAVDPEDLRQYAEDVGRSSYPFLDTVLREAGIADLGTRLKAIKALHRAWRTTMRERAMPRGARSSRGCIMCSDITVGGSIRRIGGFSIFFRTKAA